MNSKGNSLDALGEVSRGRSRHRPRNAPYLYGGQYPFIQTADITKSDLHVTKFTQTYSEEGLAQSKLWKQGVLCIVNAGVNTGDNAILGIDACFPDSVIGFQANETLCDVRFVKYFLDSIKKGIRSITMGATQDNLSVSKLLSFKVPPVSLDDQRKIAAILSSYDDLIENNKRRIELVENMANQTYCEWFTRMRFRNHRSFEFAKGVPLGWEIKKLPEVAELTYGFPFKSALFNEDGIGKPIIRIRNVPTSSTEDFTEEIAADKYIVNTGDFVVGMDGEFHMNHWCGPSAYLVQRVCRIRAKDERLSAYLAHALYAPIKHFEAILVGATVGHLGAKHLNSIDVMLPPEHLLPDLAFLEQLRKQKVSLSVRNRVLALSRDTLLTRLLSGALDVESLRIVVPPNMEQQTVAEEIHKELAHA